MTIYVILHAVVGFLSLGLAAYAWPRRRKTAVLPFIVAAVVGSLWPLLNLLEVAVPGVEFKSVVVRLRPPIILTSISALLVMALRHGGWTGSGRWLIPALAPVPALSLLFNFLPLTRGWFQHGFRPNPRVPHLLAYDGGWWARFYEFYTPLLAFAVIASLLMQAKQYRGIYRRRAIVLAAGVSTPTLLYMLQLAGLTAWTPLNLPPLGMGVTALCGAWVLLREHYFDLVPVARAVMIEQWREPVLAVNRQGEVMDLNPAAARLLGASLGLKVAELREPWGRLLAGVEGSEFARGEVRVGESAYSYEAQPLRDEHAGPQGWVLLVHDLTESERARAALEALNRDLQNEIGQRRATEARLMEAHRIETIGRLSGGVAHEFNNLMMVINGYATLLLSRMGEEDENRPALEAIAQAGEDASRLTAQLLEFSRKQVLRAELVDVRMLIEEARHMWSTLLGERIRLRIGEWDAQPTWVNVDSTKLREALTQLILNARDSIQEGGVVTVTLDRAPVPRSALLRSPGLKAGEYIRVSVADTGIGMDPATLSRALEPFFSTKGAGRGSGLGLSSAYGIARQCAGTLELESEPGAGTTARMYLPAAEAAPASGQTAPAAAGTSLGPARVLVVEDQPDVRRLLRALLEAEGHEVIEAGGVAAALQILETADTPPRILVTDLVMPGLPGHELVRRATAMAPDLRVLVISGYSSEDSGPCDGFLRKPFSPGEFSREIQRLLAPR